MSLVPHVVLLRGVNVGGAKAFKPSEMAKTLGGGGLRVVSIGAAGTFVVHGKANAATLEKRFRDALPFEADVLVLPGDDMLDLVRRAPLAGLPEDQKPFVSALATAPARPPPLPLDVPPGDAWEVRLVAVEGRFALCARRTTGGKHYPNEVVEKALGVRATTRTWSTMETLAKKLEEA